MKNVLFAIAALYLTASPFASAQHNAPAHHACLDQERQAIERGEGFGMAAVADRNSFPGPRHILELRKELELTPAQEHQVQRLLEHLQAEAGAVGQELLAKEAELERLFAPGAVDSAAARRLVEESAALRGKLRWVHLSAHLEAQGILTAEQRARYQAIRHAPRPH